MTAPLIEYLNRRIELVDSISQALERRRKARPASQQAYRTRAAREHRVRMDSFMTMAPAAFGVTALSPFGSSPPVSPALPLQSTGAKNSTWRATMNAKQIAALNAAGEALKGLGIGRVKLSWRPADTLVPRDEYAVSLEAPDVPGLCIGVGYTPHAALVNALAQVAAKTALAA